MAKLIDQTMTGPDNPYGSGSLSGVPQFPTAAYNSNDYIFLAAAQSSGTLPFATHYFQTINNLTCAATGVLEDHAPFTFSGVAANSIDTKIDDGMPLTGSVLAIYAPLMMAVPYAGSGYNCVTASRAYNVADTVNQCELAFKF